MAYNTSNEYKEIIYSGDAKHRLVLSFLENADTYCEKLTVKSRIIPNGSKVFGLGNFMSKEAELILHDINLENIPEQIEISIGTNIEANNYEDIPIGIFNISDKPTTDKNKTTFKLYDNAIKFDFGYNALPLIELNGGTVTKMQILQDICEKAGVELNVESFSGDDDEIGIYDNTITARTYVAYLAEQAGAIATIDRYGRLSFVYINNLETIKIPLNIVEKYKLGKTYTIGRVVYEDGVRKYDNPHEDEEYSGDILYLDASNPYISSQEQIDNIYDIVESFAIDSVTTGKIYGDPSIDPYDLIQIYGYYEILPNGNKRFVDDDSVVVFTTLATHTMTYNGKIISVYETQIGEEVRKENVSKIGEANFEKYAKTEINNINNNIREIVVEQNEQSGRLSELDVNIQNIQALFQLTGGSNLIKNSQFLLTDDVWTRTISSGGFCTELGEGYNSSLVGQTVALSNIVMKNASIVTKNENITNLKIGQTYNLSFYYTLGSNASATVNLIGNQIGQVVLNETYTEEKSEITKVEVSFTATDTSYTLTFSTTTTLDGYFTIYDLMLNSGDSKPWEPAMSEIYSTVLKMSQLGLQIYASGSNTITLMTSMGFAVYKSSNGEIGEVVTEFTSEGINTKNIAASNRIKVGTWVSRDFTLSGKTIHIEYMEEI